MPQPSHLQGPPGLAKPALPGMMPPGPPHSMSGSRHMAPSSSMAGGMGPPGSFGATHPTPGPGMMSTGAPQQPPTSTFSHPPSSSAYQPPGSTHGG